MLACCSSILKVHQKGSWNQALRLWNECKENLTLLVGGTIFTFLCFLIFFPYQACFYFEPACVIQISLFFFFYKAVSLTRTLNDVPPRCSCGGRIFFFHAKNLLALKYIHFLPIIKAPLNSAAACAAFTASKNTTAGSFNYRCVYVCVCVSRCFAFISLLSVKGLYEKRKSSAP